MCVGYRCECARVLACTYPQLHVRQCARVPAPIAFHFHNRSRAADRFRSHTHTHTQHTCWPLTAAAADRIYFRNRSKRRCERTHKHAHTHRQHTPLWVHTHKRQPQPHYSSQACACFGLYVCSVYRMYLTTRRPIRRYAKSTSASAKGKRQQRKQNNGNSTTRTYTNQLKKKHKLQETGARQRRSEPSEVNARSQLKCAQIRASAVLVRSCACFTWQVRAHRATDHHHNHPAAAATATAAAESATTTTTTTGQHPCDPCS